jgi:hypothetical protein
MGNCDRCKAEDVNLDVLTLQGATKGTTFNLCHVCMGAARISWQKFMKPPESILNHGTTAPEGLTGDRQMPFGAHKGKRMREVPASYLIWIADQHWISKYPSVLKYINTNRDALEEEIASDDKD